MRLLDRCLALLSVSAALLAASVVHAQVKPEIPTRVVFSRYLNAGQPVDRVAETYSWGTQTLPAHRIAVPGSGFAHHTFGTQRPAGATTQVLKFRFKSNSLFTYNPGAHFFVAGLGESTSWYNRGRGFIVGGLSGTANPCAAGIRSQPETWWSVPATLSASNYVWGGGYCGSALSEYVWYDVELHVNNGSYFYYNITQSGTTVGGGFAIADNINPEANVINNKLTGFTFGLVFADDYSSSWELEFDAIAVSWF